MKKNIYEYKNAYDVTSELFKFDNFVYDLMRIYDECLYDNIGTKLFDFGIQIFNENLDIDTVSRFTNILAFGEIDNREKAMFELLKEYYNDNIVEYAKNQLKKADIFHGMDTLLLISKCYLFTNKVYYGYYYNLDNYNIIDEWSFNTLYNYYMLLHNDEKIVYELMVNFYKDNMDISRQELEKILEDMDAKLK